MNKKGSSIVMLAMIFVALMAAVVMAIKISRTLVVKSECEVFGNVWARAILSEYDIHLLEDYNILAYQGDERSLAKKLDAYMNYSCQGKLDADISNTYVSLSGYELAEISNFEKALKNSCGNNILDMLKEGETRTQRGNIEEGEDMHVIKNSVVLDTLPSNNIKNTIDLDSIVDKIQNGEFLDIIKEGVQKTSLSMAFMYKYLGSHVNRATDKKSLFINEWEYVLMGEKSDEANYTKCRNALFTLRNGLNLVAIYKDPSKIELVVTVAEMITPGPGAAITQALIAELWAAAETDEDMKTLYDGGKVPLIKTPDTWKTDLDMIINSSDFSSKLDNESKKMLDENKKKIDDEISQNKYSGNIDIENGLAYEGYLMVMLLGVNENVRMLRIMDIVQINMKYRYYDDFNMREYYVGTGFTLKANGRNYEIKDEYK